MCYTETIYHPCPGRRGDLTRCNHETYAHCAFDALYCNYAGQGSYRETI